jgi:glycosyltransferase involved in cell wall biosynthesis
MRMSIAMATYNGAKYIQEQLKSLSEQTILPYELVVCDDGSTDDTLTIVRKYAKSAPFAVRVFQNEENLHYTGNFMKAASLCNGDAIAFCDQDDIWDSRKIAACAAALQNGPVDLVIHEGRIIDSIGRLTAVKIPDLSFEPDVLNRTPYNLVAVGFAMALRREVIEEVLACWSWDEYSALKRRHGGPLGHDLFIYAWCFERKKISFLPEELVRYRLHGQNFSIGLDIIQGRIAKLKGYLSRLTVDKLNYRLPGQKWAAEVEFLNSYINRSRPDELPGLAGLSDWYSRKSKLWLDRAIIYDKDIPRKKRCCQVAHLLFSGGYLSRKMPKLGIGSMGKDLIIAAFC